MKKILGVTLALTALTVLALNVLVAVYRQNANVFMNKAAQSGMAEVALGNLALQKSQNGEIRRFAQMIVDDHTKANDELKSLASAKNVRLPAKVSSDQRSAANKLNGISGAEIDKAFMRQMVKDHEAVVNLFQKQANSNDDADLKAFAANHLPILQGHLQMARSLSGSTKNSNSHQNINTNGN